MTGGMVVANRAMRLMEPVAVPNELDRIGGPRLPPRPAPAMGPAEVIGLAGAVGDVRRRRLVRRLSDCLNA